VTAKRIKVVQVEGMAIIKTQRERYDALGK
jgi:hypothetical protein